jgi:uncharacterized protein (UPF0210 family)
MAQLRTVTLGMPLDIASPARTAEQVKKFFAGLEDLLYVMGLEARCFRFVAPSMPDGVRNLAPDVVGRLAAELEAALGERIWCCLPGPVCGHNDSQEEDFAAVEAILTSTQHIFSNAQVGHRGGLDNHSISLAARTMTSLAQSDAHQQANFRFAAIANVEPGTPFFPAAYHRGEPGFSIALELAEDFNRCTEEGETLAERLDACRKLLVQRVALSRRLAETYAQKTGVRFLGFDLSLAPFPGPDSSAVAVVEKLAGSRIGQLDFLFSLYALNDMLQHAIEGLPMVGFNGTMLSVLEDTRLAEAAADGEVSIKDLLLYATVCGCGLDMIPVARDASTGQLASLIRAIATIAQKWRKPLLARILPSSVDAAGYTRYQHDFLVNTRVLPLDGTAQVPVECFGFFHPLRRVA